MQFLIYQELGVKVVYDSIRYLNAAEKLIANGFYPKSYYFSYIGYIYFVAVFLKAGLAAGGIVLAQVLLAGLATICFYKLAFRLSESWLPATSATFLLIAWPDLQSWHFYVHTESLLISLSLIYSWLFLTAEKLKYRLLLLLLLPVFLSIRPNGIILVVASLAFLGIEQIQSSRLNRVALLALPVVFAGGVVVLNALLTNLKSTFKVIIAYNSGVLVGGYPAWALKLPGKPFIPDQAVSQLVQLGQYVMHYPGYFLKLAAVKFLIFFAQVKPYYSLLHNVAIGLFIYPCYYFFLKAFFLREIRLPVKVYIGTLVLVQALLSALTLPDWDNRFIAPVLPFIFLFSGIGIGQALKRRIPEFYPEKLPFKAGR